MNTKTELQKLLEEDISTLRETLIRADALPPRYVRSIAAPIVRRWLIDKQLNILAKEIGLTIELPILDTSLAFEKLSTLDNKIIFYMSGGVYLGGEFISSIYYSSQEFSGEPIIHAEPNVILYPAEKLLNLKRVFHNGNTFNMNQIITFLSNKQGGVHFNKNYDKYKTWQVDIEKAANFLKLGNPYNEDNLSLNEEHDSILVVLPLEKGYEWNCLEIEVLSAAQSLVNIHCNKVRLIDGHVWE